ncbi:hypothetical protein CPC08DRAFT_705273 [Agrocybe pediades]|nr:hypothetical protein CPC08DRAFT_705273 [Agrocybe pediades]
MDGNLAELQTPYAKTLSGALIVGALLNWGLLGILATQTYGYYLAFPKDRLIAKIIVYTVFVLEAAQTTLVSCDVFMAISSSFGDEIALDKIRNYWISIPISGGLSGGIGQLFFAYRIWKVTAKESKRTPLVIVILSTASIVSAFIAAETFFKARQFSVLLGTTHSGSFSLVSIGVWNGIGAICDITIALAMPYYLMRHGTGLPSTHIVVVKLIRLIIETGGLTAIVAILNLCLYFANTPSFLIAGLTLSKVYANTMLVILNNRAKIVDGRDSLAAGRRRRLGEEDEEEQEHYDGADEVSGTDIPLTPTSGKSGSGEEGSVRTPSLALGTSNKRAKTNRRGPSSTVLVTRERLVFSLTDEQIAKRIGRVSTGVPLSTRTSTVPSFVLDGKCTVVEESSQDGGSLATVDEDVKNVGDGDSVAKDDEDSVLQETEQDGVLK